MYYPCKTGIPAALVFIEKFQYFKSVLSAVSIQLSAKPFKKTSS
jgi:hypothetical protein